MPSIKCFIDIGATPEQVWRVLADFPAYPRWNPFMREVQGQARENERVRVHLRLPGGRAWTFRARVTRAIPAAELRWRGGLWVRGVFDGEHTFIIVPHGVTGVRFIQRERFTGLLARVLVPLIRKRTLRGFEIMNLALKRKLEGKNAA